MKTIGKKTTAIALLAGALCVPALYAHAASTATITITGKVLDTTCTFDNADYPVTLTDVSATAFTDNTTVQQITDVPVAMTCGADSTAVKINVAGTADADDATAFANTGTATGVALRLQNTAGETLDPKGTSTEAITMDETHKGTYTFHAGYVGTKPGQVAPGDFTSVVNLTFDYS